MPKKNGAMFSDARMLNDGSFTTPQGNLVQTLYVDLSGALPLGGFSVAKASEPRFDLRTTKTIRLSRPGVFRSTGEVLVKDEQEGRARTSTTETVQESAGEEELDRRTRALNAAMRLGHTKMSATGTTRAARTKTAAATVTHGKDGLIYCTSLWPGPHEENAWRRTFPDSYTSVARIYRPTQFAQALGFEVCEHIGAAGKPAPTRATFHGFRTVEVERTSQIVLHGPVVYVEDPYRHIAETEHEAGWARICSMIFVKSRDYAAQKEYRFALLSIRPEVGEVVDLPVSGMLMDCLLPVRSPATGADAPVTVSPEESEGGKEVETSRSYTYRRRVAKRETGNWRVGEEDDSGRETEEVVEETVTSPEEVPEPFPVEEKQPDVIVFHQVGERYRFVHNAYRDEETRRWRIETLRENPAIVTDAGSFPEALEIPPEVRFDSVEERPVHPGFVLELCLSPSAPRPPLEHQGLRRCSRAEVDHVQACGQSLGRAVELLDGVERERAAASVWYAFRFIQDLVGLFGPIVRTVCVIRECVAVVELEPAPLSNAVAWATFSGTGTYTVYVHRGKVEELVFPGRFLRAGPISESTYLEALRDNGWGLKDRGLG